MGNKNVHLGFLHKPKMITPEDRVRLREMLEFILLGTYFEGKDDEIEQMMKSTSRVVCLKFIESMIAVNEPVNHNHISKFFDIYIEDINSRMTLKCNIAKEFRHNPFSIRKEVAMIMCLMIGELVTNSLNQAMGSKKELSLLLTMGIDPRKENQFTLGYMDNGKGWVGNLDLRNTKQYGLFLCRLLEVKLEGKAIMANEPGNGVGMVYDFPLDKMQ
jgi:two-component sensor histidine kinase